ncbi:MAG: hypothetical protein PHR92_07700 [Lachnospiraceae bacterium]|nr:hypothetical protein [Lachnospiraceae bacterium]
MKCIEAQQLVKPYLEKQLSDKELEHFLDHVESCTECYDELEIYYSIYSTLEEHGEKKDPDEYNFKKKLNQDLKVSRRYLHLRKAYRFFRFMIVALAELLLVISVITGIEMLGENGSKGTTLYRLIYGDQGVVLPVTPLTEPGREDRLGTVTIPMAETASPETEKDVSGSP